MLSMRIKENDGVTIKDKIYSNTMQETQEKKLQTIQQRYKVVLVVYNVNIINPTKKAIL